MGELIDTFSALDRVLAVGVGLWSVEPPVEPSHPRGCREAAGTIESLRKTGEIICGCIGLTARGRCPGTS